MALMKHLQVALLTSATLFSVHSIAQAQASADRAPAQATAAVAPVVDPNGDIAFHTLPIDLNNCQLITAKEERTDKLQRCSLAAFGLDLYWFNTSAHSAVQFAAAGSEQPSYNDRAEKLLDKPFFEAQGPLKVFSRKAIGEQPPLRPLVAFIDYLVGDSAKQLKEERWMVYMTDPRANCQLVPVSTAATLAEAQTQAQSLLVGASNCKAIAQQAE